MTHPSPTRAAGRPETTLVVLLGASKFIDPSFTSAEAFGQVAVRIQEYFISPIGFGLKNPDRQFLPLFDLQKEPSEHLDMIARFIAAGRQRTPNPTDLVLWYVGHGIFDHKRNYCLTLHGTKQVQRGPSSIRMTDLANLLVHRHDGVATDLRTHLIIDACYSGNAPSEFMGEQTQIPASVLAQELPARGVAAICSSPPNEHSHFDYETGTTVFSGALLNALWSGSPSRSHLLTLEEIYKVATAQILEHKDEKKRIRPVLHNPRSEDGTVSQVPLFPNRWGASERGSRRFKAVIFDLDGTLLVGYQYSWSLIWAALGYPDKLRKELYRQHDQGVLTYDQWCQKCCEYFRTQNFNEKMLNNKVFLKRSRRRISLVKNYGSVMRTLKDWRMVCGIVSGGISTFLQRLPNCKKNFPHIFINEFEYNKSGSLRSITPTRYDYPNKWGGLVEFCNREGIDPKEVVFVGDSINDSEIARRSQLSIAFSGSSQGEISRLVDVPLQKYDLNHILKIIRDKQTDTPSLPLDDSSTLPA